VIKSPRLPVGRVVAGVALISKRSAMWVVAAVTGDAIGPRIVECRRIMTPIASDACMFPDEWEVCQVMVEPQLCSPTRRDMAGLALLAKLPFVCVVVNVARATKPRNSVVDVIGVTGFTSEFFVSDRERESGFHHMIESHR